MAEVFRSDFSRVFLLEGRASPSRAPRYQGLWKAGAISWDQGDVTVYRIPDPNQYGQFVRAGKTRGEPGDPQLPIMARYTTDRSRLLTMARNGCDHDIQIHMGKCQNPQDFNRGWDKILILEAGAITSYGTEDLGALGPDERAMVNEEVPFTGEDLYEVVPITFATQAQALVGREVMDLYNCDSVQCGICGVISDGCQVVLAAVSPSVGSPGLLAELVFTFTGGASWLERVITTMGASEAPSSVRCVGEYVVVASPDSNSFHYITLSELKAGTGSWAEVTTGFVATKGPLHMYSAGPSQTWVVGQGGYIYYTEDPTSGVAVQSAGDATIQDLAYIDGIDNLNIIAVGASNAIVKTSNGGLTWQTVTGPSVGVDLNTVAMRTADEWMIGTAGGRLFYTLDGGVTWTEKGFSGSGTGEVRDIKFTTRSVGYMSHSTAAPSGRILRTLDGGNSWYVAPEKAGSIPAHDYINRLAVCDDPNVIYGGGLGDDATDGVIIKGA